METKIYITLDKYDLDYLLKLLIQDNQNLIAQNELLMDDVKMLRSRAQLAEKILMEEESA